MKYAWIENDRVRDVCHGDPNELYHPEVAKFYTTQVPDDAVNGDGWVNGQLVKPEPPAPAPPPPRQWTQTDVRSKLTLVEKVRWDNESAPEVKTVKTELATPRNLQDTTELLQLLVDTSIISQTSMDSILQ